MTSTADVERNLGHRRAAGRGGGGARRRLRGPARELRLPALGGRAGAGGAGARRPVGAPHGRARARAHGSRSSSAACRSASRATRASTTRRCCSGPTAQTLAVYRKIHLFDIDLPGMEHLKESRAVVPGEDVVVAEAPFGPLGLTICYDLRFPELYRELVPRGARVLAVPSAFTERTGKDHWEVLLRARAIENLAYVVAPAQVGHARAGPRLPRPRPRSWTPGAPCSPRSPTARASRSRSWTSSARTASAASCPRSLTAAAAARRAPEPADRAARTLTKAPVIRYKLKVCGLARTGAPATGERATREMPTYIPKADEIDRKWFVIDAKDQVLGKLAATAAASPDRQAQADLHALPGHRRPRDRDQRRPGPPDRAQGRRTRSTTGTPATSAG